MHAIPFAAREVFDLFLLIRPSKIETGAVAARIHFGFTELDCVLAVRNHLVHALVAVEAPILIHVAKLDGLSDLDRSSIRLLLADDHLKHGGLAGTVRADHTDNAAFR